MHLQAGGTEDTWPTGDDLAKLQQSQKVSLPWIYLTAKICSTELLEKVLSCVSMSPKLRALDDDSKYFEKATLKLRMVLEDRTVQHKENQRDQRLTQIPT